MNDGLRDDCFQNIITALTTTSGFRWRKARQYPEDIRNFDAAETCKHIANNATELPIDYWEMLQPLYDPNAKHWRDAIRHATNNIGFSNRSSSFAFLLRNLISLLPQSEAA
jgi:hypothetical protein